MPGLPARVQAAAHLRRPRSVAHELPKFAPVLTGGLPKKALEARTAVMTHQVLRQQLAGVLNEPEHRR
eukprot:7900743-Alexandrium_andersonii.AAC.1